MAQCQSQRHQNHHLGILRSVKQEAEPPRLRPSSGILVPRPATVSNCLITMTVHVPFGPARLKPDYEAGHIRRKDAWLQGKYRLFNRRYFEGRLPDWPCYFRGIKNSNTNGMYWFRRGITINPYNEETRILAVLLHEMVHAEQAMDRRPVDHGRWFKSRMRELTVLTKGRYGKLS